MTQSIFKNSRCAVRRKKIYKTVVPILKKSILIWTHKKKVFKKLFLIEMSMFSFFAFAFPNFFYNEHLTRFRILPPSLLLLSIQHDWGRRKVNIYSSKLP